MGGRAAGYLLLAPFLVVFAVFGLLPMLFTAWVSLHDWHLLDGPRSFTGTGNYLRLLSDWRFYNALGNTVSIFLLSTVVQLLAALGLAALLNRPLRAATWWRAGVLLPNVVSVVAVALVFGQLFGDTSGTVNAVLQSLGLDPVDWHGDRLAAHLAVSVMVIWRWTGYNALLYLAAMQSIPQERYDAAALDGASRWRAFWSITVPGIRPTILFTVVISTIGGLQLFTEPQLFDPLGTAGTGGTDRQFQTLVMYLYERGFTDYDAGYAAAVAWAVVAVSGIVVLVNFGLVRRMVARS
ncbi:MULTISPECIES: sugar ABC transporter permease [Thermocrispum]|jgi:cellobiose transport system permease protein|uniref:Sugar ABC transporter permease n=1 Tax=Thermocrispum agreste TaxID=37925 RepID=A0A2W4LIJ4_9PSEU|nr:MULTISPECIES: sugar ABC transporter permease [Thermocrispum]PZN00970.1 MAG: sugar ABC transporter permease [Thermocrispum agreste]